MPEARGEEQDPFEGTRMTLGEHLEELRRRLLRCAVVFALALAAGWALRIQITDIVLQPYLRETVSDMTVRAGFPPVFLAPMNFDAIFQQRQRVEPAPAATH